MTLFPVTIRFHNSKTRNLLISINTKHYFIGTSSESTHTNVIPGPAIKYIVYPCL